MYVSMNEELPELITPEERAAMLADITRVSLAAGVRLSPEKALSVSTGAAISRKSPIEQLAFIEHLVPLLARAMIEIRRSPIRANRTATRTVRPPIRARRVLAASALAAVRRGHFDRHWEETISEPTSDTPENRFVKSFLAFFQRGCIEIGLRASSEHEPEVADRAAACSQRLRHLIAGSHWEQIETRPEEWKQPPTARALACPAYARICAARDHYRREFVFDTVDPLPLLASRENWQLYEMWCLFQTLEALMTLGYAPASVAVTFRRQEVGLTMRLSQGETSRIRLIHPSGRRLSLLYQQTFAQGDRSLSRTMQPDITIEEIETDRQWILDAKFKAYAQPGDEGDDINQMHAYRDAILGPQGQKSVVHAWCLFVGQAQGQSSESITYGSVQGVVGALLLRPGRVSSLTNLRALLLSWLQAEPPPSVPPASP